LNHYLGLATGNSLVFGEGCIIAYRNLESDIKDIDFGVYIRGPFGGRKQLTMEALACNETKGSFLDKEFMQARFDTKGKAGWVLNHKRSRRTPFHPTELVCLEEDVITTFPSLSADYRIPQAVRDAITAYCQTHNLSTSFKKA